MSKLHKKFIIIDNLMLLWGSVQFHIDLLPRTKEKSCVNGGGYFHIDFVNKIIYFYSTSSEFGNVTKELFLSLIENNLLRLPGRYLDYEKVFSLKSDLSEVIKDYENGTKP